MHESDASNLFNIWSDPHVTKYMNINNFTEIEQARDMINFLNTNSINTLRRLNFTFAGTLRQVEKSKGKFIDLNVYSKLTTD